ncbi:MAG: cobalamin-binding protein [Thermoplasmata archaeon]|nr:cobalamin-binding protein [Candidatus Sysuiplasma acidicola]
MSATAERIVSLLPSATEMLYAIGAGDSIVGVTHECDFPEEAKKKPVVIRSAIDMSSMTASEIDAAVSSRLRAGLDLYVIDTNLLSELQPDLIIGQGLCEVCAASGKLIERAIASLPRTPRLMDLSPRSVDDILGNLIDLGAVTGREHAASVLVSSLRSRLSAVKRRTTQLGLSRRVFFMEWTDPVYCAGHWIPGMIETAGGVDRLGRKEMPSVRIPWESVLEWNPEVIIVSSCGMSLSDMVREADKLTRLPSWNELTAVWDGRVYAVDASSYFARPGPRVVTGVELLAHLLHPGQFTWSGPPGAFRSLSILDAIV